MKHKLLVAEDVSHERAALCSTLQQHLGDHLTVFEAKDGREALALYARELPKIVILNIEMPYCTGLEVARQIREHSKNCAILFTSDFDNFSYAKEAIALRALDYITKPVEKKKLILSVEEALQHIIQLETVVQDKYPAAADSGDKDTEITRISLVREDIHNFIEKHYMEELSMKNAAHAMNYSDAYFCKLFKQCFHTNFSTYLNTYRVEKAKTMMENPRINIKDIGLACGYSDSNYFSRVFKRITGQTPTEYRLIIMEKALKN